MNKKIKCLRCGKCCIVFNHRKQLWENCRFLAYDTKQKIFYCRVYFTRIGRYLGHMTWCRYREDLKYNIPGCPYNKKGQSMHPAYINEDPGYCMSRSWVKGEFD